MWEAGPSSPMPEPSIDKPVAEYSQSMRCRPASPGALTILPTNHDSGAGQYCVTATSLSHLPLACLLGGGGMWVGEEATGASLPPPSPAPPDPELGGVADPTPAPP